MFNLNYKTMKNSKLFLCLILGLLIVSCSDDDDNLSTQPALTDEEAVEIIEANMTKESAGATETIYEYSIAYEQEFVQNVQCNQLVVDSYNLNYDGTFVQADYDFNWQYTINCNAFSIPQSATFTSSGSGFYTTQRINSDDTSSLTTSVTGLQPTASNMVYNGNYTREGAQEINTNVNTRNITTNFDAVVKDITVSKSNYEIVSGMFEFTLTGSSNQGDFSFVGTVIFNGDGTATINLNGNQFVIDIN